MSGLVKKCGRVLKNVGGVLKNVLKYAGVLNNAVKNDDSVKKCVKKCGTC